VTWRRERRGVLDLAVFLVTLLPAAMNLIALRRSCVPDCSLLAPANYLWLLEYWVHLW
jgi:hypothetical protein